MTLDLIIPHYKEPWETCKYLFDSIALQRGICFDNIRAIVVHDGDEPGINESVDFGDYYPNETQIKEFDFYDDRGIGGNYSCFEDYGYKIVQHHVKHGGVSAARNYGLDHSDADYVMFCDIDDGFLNNYGLHLIFSAMQEGADYIFSNFVEEWYPDNNQMSITRHEDDFTFMHGKVYRRKFLTENNIRFDPALTIHEDGYFNAVALSVAKREGKIKKIDTPIYLWRWNDNSTVRSNSTDFVLRTYEHVINARIGVCRQLRDRGLDKDFRTAVCMTVMNSYYDHQKPSYHVPKNKEYLKRSEKAFKQFWNEFGRVFRDCTNAEIAEIAIASRKNACEHGMLLELQDLRSWLKHIGNEVK